jgi:hypothetical protein
MAESVKSVTPEPMDVENRKIVNMMCDIKPKEESCDLLVNRLPEFVLMEMFTVIFPVDDCTPHG